MSTKRAMRGIRKAARCMLLVPLVTSCATAGVGTAGPAGVEEEARRFRPDSAAGLRLEAQENSAHATLSDSILALTHGLADAWIRLDADDFLRRFSDDLVFYYEGTPWDRATFEAVVRNAIASLEASTFDIVDPEVEILGPDAAVISSESAS